jgi:hypothetical protein
MNVIVNDKMSKSKQKAKSLPLFQNWSWFHLQQFVLRDLSCDYFDDIGVMDTWAVNM